MPILLGLCFGMVEFGYFFFVKHTLQAAARDGARMGIVPNGTNAKITATVATAMKAAGFEKMTYEIEIQNGTNDANLDVSTAPAQTPVKVVVKCNWSAIGTGLRPLGLIVETTQVKGTTVMLKE
ncbi:MAG: pilus assembly protein [Planctomycetota bacterium]|nr:pilus assembly protein [Planctomycetota bacterium]